MATTQHSAALAVEALVVSPVIVTVWLVDHTISNLPLHRGGIDTHLTHLIHPPVYCVFVGISLSEDPWPLLSVPLQIAVEALVVSLVIITWLALVFTW